MEEFAGSVITLKGKKWENEKEMEKLLPLVEPTLVEWEQAVAERFPRRRISDCWLVKTYRKIVRVRVPYLTGSRQGTSRVTE